MGCGGSKVDDLPLVMRCRQRKEMIKSAMDYRYDLSSSHLAYFHSLKDIGYALSRFIDEEVVIPSSSYTSSPVLTLPSDEGKTNKSSGFSGSISHIHSINGNEDSHSHLHLSSDSESDLDSSSGGHIHIHDDSDGYDGSVPGNKSKPPLSSSYPPYNHNQTNWDDPFVMNGGPTPSQHYEGTHQTNQGDPYGANSAPPSYQSRADPAFESAWGPYGGIFYSHSGHRGNTNFYYMKKSAPASRTVIHQEAWGFQETGQCPDPSDYNSYESGSFFGFSMSGLSAPEEPNQHNPAKAPSPPPPPKVSGWDFLNFFDGYDNGYQSHGYGFGSVVSSPDTVELREREGIPDLEEETENESHSEGVHIGKMLDTKRNIGKNTTRSFPEENTEVSLLRGRSRSNGGSSKRVPPGNSEGTSKGEYDEGTSNSVPLQNDEGSPSVNVKVDMSMPETLSEGVGEKNESKKEVSFDVDAGSIHEVESSRLSSLTTLSAHGSRDVQEVFNEIKDEFDIAFGYGKEVAVMLEAGKVPYRPRFAVLKVALSRILYLMAPSFSSSLHPKQSDRSHSQITKLARSYHQDAVTDIPSISLSSTLEKLYAWEKKLYKEVKDEERLRLVYDNMCKRLKDLDARGAESSKIDAAQASVRRLLTKLDVAIKAIDAIASKIQKVRDEELQPQVSELIYGFIRMWKLIVKCHQKQFQAIMASKTLNLKANTSSGSDATLELKTGLLTWRKHFEDWINAHKCYVNSLNGWLEQCIEDGNVPFSPGRIGAPPIFIICNDWHKGIQRVSNETVLTAFHIFGLRLRQLLERQDDELNQRLKTEQLAKDFSEKRQHLWMEHDMLSETMGVVGSDPKLDLHLLRKKTDEARARHTETLKLVHAVASNSLQGGMIPLFKALQNFTCDALKAHEQVRLERKVEFIG